MRAPADTGRAHQELDESRLDAATSSFFSRPNQQQFDDLGHRLPPRRHEPIEGAPRRARPGWYALAVVYDARGNFTEPHTKVKVPLGTLQVRRYLQQVQRHKVEKPTFGIWEEFFPTMGPQHRFGAILFIEKEGFMPLFEEVQLAERYDLAIMSTKGMSVTASRELVDQLCAVHAVPLLVLHDFDKAGFSIAGSLRRSTRRYRFAHGHEGNVIDLGLRLEDVAGLETESVHFDSEWKARENLRENGATDEEIDFLIDERVELNAFASDEFVQWIELKLQEHGIAKVVPRHDTLAVAYQRMRKEALVQAQIDKALANFEKNAEPQPTVPANLLDRVKERLSEEQARSWDDVLREIAEDDHEETAP